jgi:hypothetical protein
MVTIERVYAAGVCNISKEEEGLRLAAGWIGTGLTVAAALAFIALGVPALWRLTLFLPAVLAASGFLQAGMHFCANYGLRGVFNVKNQVGQTQSVEQAEFVKKDKEKALQILVFSVLIGVVAALVGVFLL